MMRQLLLSTLCLTAPLAWAQPSITQSAIAPQGIAMSMYGLAEGAVMPSIADGAEQTWNLSGVALQSLGTARFGTSAGTPYANAFPQANRVFAQEFQGQGTIYEYVRNSAAGLDLFGRGIPYNPITYTQPSRILKFPLAFNESYTDSYVNENGANVRTWTYGGHGTVTTALGTFSNVAKMSNTQGHVILWNLDPLYPVVYNEEGSIYFFAKTGYIDEVGIAEQAAGELRAWPNPAHDRLAVEGTWHGQPWRVSDLQGRQLLHGVAGPGPLELDLLHLAAGSYVATVGNTGAQRHVHFVKQ